MITEIIIDGKWHLARFETELLSDLYAERDEYAKKYNLFGGFESAYESFDPDGKCVAILVFREKDNDKQ